MFGLVWGRLKSMCDAGTCLTQHATSSSCRMQSQTKGGQSLVQTDVSSSPARLHCNLGFMRTLSDTERRLDSELLNLTDVIS